jgi:hypothetical protein
LIWASLNDLSFLTLLSLISLTVPGLAHSLQQVVLKLLFLDVLLTDQWLLPWIEEIQYEEILDATNGNIKYTELLMNKSPLSSYF